MENRFLPSNKFIVRMPYMPYCNHMLSQYELQEIIHIKEFQEALYYASPDLYDEVQKYLSGDLPEKKTKRMISTLYKYMQRIHYRCTPFGLFSFCSIGEYGTETKTSIDYQVKKHYRYDCKFLYDYVYYLLKTSDAKFIESLNICSNQTILSIGSEYHMSVQREDGSIIDIKLPQSDLLKFVIDCCSENVECKKLITDCLLCFDICYSDFVEYIRKLILNGILISNINISTTGRDNFKRLYGLLKNLHPILLEDLNVTINLLNSSVSFEIKREAIDSLLVKIRSFGISVNRNLLLQIDSFSENHVQIEASVRKNLTEWFELLTRINAPMVNPLSDFISRYIARYESMAIPLLTVLNPIVGIGYSRDISYLSLLVKNIFSSKGKQKSETKIHNYILSEFEHIVLQKIVQNGNLSEKQIVLNRNDFLKDSRLKDEEFCRSYTCMYKIVGYNENGPIISNVQFSGPSSSCLISRFADSLPGINNMLKHIDEMEQKVMPGKILAEISHLSSPHVGNVQIRPTFRQYELPYLAFNDKSDNQIIKLKDLLVRISNRKVLLYSTQDDKEVVPCFSSAFNYKNNTTQLYQFLGEIQHQYSYRGLSVSMGTLLSLLQHLPRIVYKNIIVDPETWMLDCFWNGRNEKNPLEVFRSLHVKLKMSPFLTFYQGDNYLIIDINSDLSLNELFKLTRNQQKVVLSEFLPLSKDFHHYNSILEIVQPIFQENDTTT